MQRRNAASDGMRLKQLGLRAAAGDYNLSRSQILRRPSDCSGTGSPQGRIDIIMVLPIRTMFSHMITAVTIVPAQ